MLCTQFTTPGLCHWWRPRYNQRIRIHPIVANIADTTTRYLAINFNSPMVTNPLKKYLPRKNIWRERCCTIGLDGDVTCTYICILAGTKHELIHRLGYSKERFQAVLSKTRSLGLLNRSAWWTPEGCFEKKNDWKKTSRLLADVDVMRYWINTCSYRANTKRC